MVFDSNLTYVHVADWCWTVHDAASVDAVIAMVYQTSIRCCIHANNDTQCKIMHSFLMQCLIKVATVQCNFSNDMSETYVMNCHAFDTAVLLLPISRKERGSLVWCVAILNTTTVFRIMRTTLTWKSCVQHSVDASGHSCCNGQLLKIAVTCNRYSLHDI